MDKTGVLSSMVGTPAEEAAVFCLIDRAQASNAAAMGVAEMARFTSVSRPALHQALKRLVRRGWVRRHQAASGSSLYELSDARGLIVASASGRVNDGDEREGAPRRLGSTARKRIVGLRRVSPREPDRENRDPPFVGMKAVGHAEAHDKGRAGDTEGVKVGPERARAVAPPQIGVQSEEIEVPGHVLREFERKPLNDLCQRLRDVDFESAIGAHSGRWSGPRRIREANA
ncbi:MAG: helix-turn-helix domain-containing protein [Planctomycetes bacterium]|nr:helix-turn-helix domain-containing protein [Planctomycetota bacterium]